MGKRAADVELFVGNMSSIQREDSAFYAKRRTASHDNRTRTNSSQSRLSPYCESTSEEPSAGNPHAGFCGSRGRVTASGHPVTLNLANSCGTLRNMKPRPSIATRPSSLASSTRPRASSTTSTPDTIHPCCSGNRQAAASNGFAWSAAAR